MALTEIRLKICSYYGSFDQKGSRPLLYCLKIMGKLKQFALKNALKF